MATYGDMRSAIAARDIERIVELYADLHDHYKHAAREAIYLACREPYDIVGHLAVSWAVHGWYGVSWRLIHRDGVLFSNYARVGGDDELTAQVYAEMVAIVAWDLLDDGFRPIPNPAAYLRDQEIGQAHVIKAVSAAMWQGDRWAADLDLKMRMHVEGWRGVPDEEMFERVNAIRELYVRMRQWSKRSISWWDDYTGRYKITRFLRARGDEHGRRI